MTTKKTNFAPKRGKATEEKEGFLTMTAVAKLRKTSRKTLEQWRNDGCLGLPPGKYDAAAVDAWAQANGKRAGDAEIYGSVEEKRREEIRKLRLANDLKEGRLVERAWVAERVQRASGDLNSFRAKSEAEHPTRFSAAAGDVAKCRTIVRGIWDEVFSAMQSMQKHFRE